MYTLNNFLTIAATAYGSSLALTYHFKCFMTLAVNCQAYGNASQLPYYILNIAIYLIRIKQTGTGNNNLVTQTILFKFA